MKISFIVTQELEYINTHLKISNLSFNRLKAVTLKIIEDVNINLDTTRLNSISLKTRFEIIKSNSNSDYPTKDVLKLKKRIEEQESIKLSTITKNSGNRKTSHKSKPFTYSNEQQIQSRIEEIENLFLKRHLKAIQFNNYEEFYSYLLVHPNMDLLRKHIHHLLDLAFVKYINSKTGSAEAIFNLIIQFINDHQLCSHDLNRVYEKYSNGLNTSKKTHQTLPPTDLKEIQLMRLESNRSWQQLKEKIIQVSYI